MATRSIAKSIVELEADVKKLKTTQFAHGEQYVGVDNKVVLNGTINYDQGISAWYYTLDADIVFIGQSDFPLVGVKGCRVFENNTEIGVRDIELDQYYNWIHRLNDGVSTLRMQRYVNEGEDANSTSYFNIVFDIESSSIVVPNGTPLRIEITFNANTTGHFSVQQIEY